MLDKKKVRKWLSRFWFVREWFRDARQWRRRQEADLARLADELSPVFVIGANRSGTSVVTYILSQHPDLEGLFAGNLDPRVETKDGHSVGFCESQHIWRHLLPDLEEGYTPFWGLPGFINKTYRNRTTGPAERKQFVWGIEKFRKTTKRPLIKDNFNSLRVGLIADVFPCARFVLVCRSLQEFTSRSLHKWANDGVGTKLDPPIASYHWKMVNMVARYDLEVYAPGRYSIVWLDNLNEGAEQARNAFNEITSSLELPPHEYDFTDLASNWKKNAPASTPSSGFEDVKSVVDAERTLLSKIDLPSR